MSYIIPILAQPKNGEAYVGYALNWPAAESEWAIEHATTLSEWQLFVSKETAYKRQWSSMSANMQQQAGVTASIVFGEKDSDCDSEIVLGSSNSASRLTFNILLLFGVICNV